MKMKRYFYIFILSITFIETYCKDEVNLIHRRQIMEKYLSEKEDVTPKKNSENTNTKIVNKEPKNETKEELEELNKDILRFKRIKLPDVKAKVGRERIVELPGNVEATMRVISNSPLIIGMCQ